MLGCRRHWVRKGEAFGLESRTPTQAGTIIEPRAGMSAGAPVSAPGRVAGMRGRAKHTPVTGHRAEDAVSMHLDGGPEAASHARRALSRLRGDLDAPLLETMRLLVTELIANSVKHASADAV